MATQVTPAPFLSGFRLIDGDQLNKTLAADQVTSQNAITVASSTVPTPLSAVVNNLSSVVASGLVQLPQALPGLNILVLNNGGNTVTLEGFASTDTIDGAASTTLTVAHRGA